MGRVIARREAVSATDGRDVTGELALAGRFCLASGRSGSEAIRLIAATEGRIWSSPMLSHQEELIRKKPLSRHGIRSTRCSRPSRPDPQMVISFGQCFEAIASPAKD